MRAPVTPRRTTPAPPPNTVAQSPPPRPSCRSRWRVTLAAFALGFSALAPPARAQESAAAPIDGCQVIAKVGSEAVLSREVLWTTNLILEKHKDQIPPQQLPEVRKRLMAQQLMSMLDMKIMYSSFRQNSPQADLAAIHANLDKPFEEKEVPRLMEQVGVTDRRKLDARLTELGTSLRERKEDFYQRMIARSWVTESVDINREVQHEEMLDYYRSHAAEFEFPTQARWEELAVRHDRYPTKAEAYRALAETGNEAYRLARAAAPAEAAFGSLAKERSQGFTAADGGLHEWTTKGSLAAERIDEALFSLPIGEMSPILESDLGFHIVRVVERHEAGRRPFTEVQNEITEKIREDRFQQAIEAKLTELRRKARIWTLFTGDIDPAEYAAAREAPAPR